MPLPIQVVLANYDPEWPRAAAAHADRLCDLGPVLLSVHHIGSTAIPGLTAKLIIDQMPLVTSTIDIDHGRGLVEALGYAWYGEYGIPGRRYCTLSDGAGTRLVQLHFFTADSPHAHRHIAFRDNLRVHPDAAREYENEKRRARDLHPDDSHAYAEENAA